MALTTTMKLQGSFWMLRSVVRLLAVTGDPASRLVGRSTESPYPLYDEIRGRGRLVSGKLPLFMSASHAVCDKILRDPRFIVVTADPITNAYLDQPENKHLVRPLQDSLMSMNPPEHTRLRKLVSPMFTLSALRRQQERIDAIVDKYLERLNTGGPVDLIHNFASPIPIQAVSALLGIPGPDDERFHRWGAVLGPALDGVKSMAELRTLRGTLVDLSEFFDELIAFRRQNPGDDVISGVLRLEPQDRPLDRRDLLAVTLLLLLAGLETTLNLIGNGVLALFAHPEQRERLVAEPDLATNMVEEILRYDSPVQFTIRNVREELELEGVRMTPKKPVLVLMAGANRDPEVFENPSAFDIGRANARDHLSFSAGIHYCLGAGLARMVAATAVRKLFERYPDLRLAGPVVHAQTRVIRAALHIPVHAGAPRPAVIS
jgi:cytochrome P450